MASSKPGIVGIFVRQASLAEEARTGTPLYAKVVAGLVVLFSLGLIVWLSLRHIFLEGPCCGDDGYFSLIAKTFAYQLDYGLPKSSEAVIPFSAEVGSGPALILPGALMIRIFGAQYWVPSLTSFILTVGLIGAFVAILLRKYRLWSVAMFLGCSLLAIICTTAYQYYYMVFLGEGPALGFTLLGAGLLLLADSSRRYVYLAGAAFGFALLTKYMQAFAVIGVAGTWLAYRLFAVRMKTLLDVVSLSVGAGVPLGVFEAIKFAFLGPEKYAAHWAYFVEFSKTLSVRPPRGL